MFYNIYLFINFLWAEEFRSAQAVRRTLELWENSATKTKYYSYHWSYGNPGNPLKNEEIVVVDEWCFVEVVLKVEYIIFFYQLQYIYTGIQLEI